MRGPWQYEKPLCSEVGGDFWFPEQNGIAVELQMAKKICSSCTHKTECLEWALDNEDFGIWGGTTNLERRKIKKLRRKKSA
jgi:WhiB family redox-sensing transcriptional regulator